MRLVFYSPRFYPLVGGLEKVVRVWAAALSAKGHEITVITDTPATTVDQFTFQVCRNLPFLQQVSIMSAAEAIVQFNVSLKGLPACIASRRPLIISHHTALFYPNGSISWAQKLKRLVSNHWAIKNICCSAYISKQFNKASVVYSPFEAGFFVNRGAPRKKFSVVYVGRLVSDKGVDILLDAFIGLRNRFPLLDLTIVGDGPEKPKLEQQLIDSNLMNRVHFTGSVAPTAIASILNETEIMIVPSRMEPFGTTVLEGLACGCRMIVSDQGGLPEAGGKWVRYFCSDDSKSLEQVLATELESPSMVDPAKVLAYLDKYSVEATASAFINFLSPN